MVLTYQFAVVFDDSVELNVFLGEIGNDFVFLVEFLLQFCYFLDIEIYLHFIHVYTSRSSQLEFVRFD